MTPTAYSLPALHTEADYQAALKLVVPYFDQEPPADSVAEVHFRALMELIEAYEATHHPMQPQDTT